METGTKMSSVTRVQSLTLFVQYSCLNECSKQLNTMLSSSRSALGFTLINK